MFIFFKFKLKQQQKKSENVKQSLYHLIEFCAQNLIKIYCNCITTKEKGNDFKMTIRRAYDEFDVRKH